MDFRKLKIAIISATVFLLGFVIAFDTFDTLVKVDSIEAGASLEDKEATKSTEKETEKESEKEGEKDRDETDELFFEDFFLHLSEKAISLNYSAAQGIYSTDFVSYVDEINPPPPRA